MTGRRTATAVVTIAMALMAPTVARADGAGSYTVQRGDGFYRIARVTGVPVDAILQANGMTLKSVIHPGQVLAIPTASPASGGGTAAPSGGALTLPKEVAGRGDLVAVFRAAAQEAGVPADLLMAIAYHESRWRADVVSKAGALGIGQVMPTTATWVARDLMREPNLDPLKAKDNIRISARLMRWLMDRAGGDVDLALAMYAQGVDGVKRNGIKPATATFIAEIATLRQQFD